jgi:2-isopropylmalate synthase
VTKPSRSIVPGTILASTPTTTPGRRSPIRWQRLMPGVRQVQGTLNGIGERCGNANLVTLIPTLKLKSTLPTGSKSVISEDQLQDSPGSRACLR